MTPVADRERERTTMKFLDEIKFDNNGLVAAVIQDAASREVLMVAYMNREALTKTIETGQTHFWSRSRGKMWLKGESSGHVQLVKEIRFDCDADALLVQVEQKVAACHAGYFSCFYRAVTPDGDVKKVANKVFDPDKVY